MKLNGKHEIEGLDFIQNPVPDVLDESDAYLYLNMINNIDQEQKKKSPKSKPNSNKQTEKPQKISEYYQNFCKK